MKKSIAFQYILKISTLFGLAILIYDFIMLLSKVDVKSISLINSDIWVSIKYLIWAIGSFYSLKALFRINPKLSVLSYFGYMILIALLTSIFDVFFLALYFRYINPNGFTEVYEYFLTVYEQVLEKDVADLFTENLFFTTYLMNISFTYIILFLFYSLFYIWFIKWTIKKQKN